MADRVGTEIAGYRIESLIARGGMGEVYLAEQDSPRRKVALKLLSPELSQDSGFRERFAMESEAAASIDHPNVIPIYQSGQTKGTLFIAMRYVEGTDLQTLLGEQGTVTPDRAARICAQIADALEAAHERGLVHRDVKPANILVGRADHAYLSDFGLIRRSEVSTAITKTGQFMGTIDYVAPEQIKGQAVDGRADIYSLGCVLYECLTGEPPFRRETEVATLYAHLEDPPLVPSRKVERTPRVLDQAVAKAMAKRPEERFATAEEFGTTIRGAVQPEIAVTTKLFLERRRQQIWAIVSLAAIIAVVALVAIIASVSGDDVNAASSTPSPSVAAAPLSASLAHADAETGKILSVTPDLSRPEDALPHVQVGEGSVWVLAASELTQVDPNDGSVVRVIALRGLFPFDSHSLAVGFRTAWVGDQGLVHRVNPATGEELRPVALWGATDPAGLAYVAVGEGNAWAVGGNGLLVQIDPLTGSKTGRSVDAGQSATGIDAGLDAVWVVDDLHGTLTRVDPTTLEIVGTYSAPGDINAITVGAGAVWLLDSKAGVVTPFHPGTEVFGAPIRVGIGPTDVQTGLGFVWVTNQAEDTLSRIDPITGEVETIPIGGPAAAIAVEDPTGTIWVVLAQVSKGGPG